MARNLDWDALYTLAKKNIRPAMKQMRKVKRMDADDWLRQAGLERRSAGADVAGAVGFVLLGCVIGLGLGVLFAPKPGTDIRKDLSQRAKEAADRYGIGAQQGTPTYAS